MGISYAYVSATANNQFYVKRENENFYKKVTKKMFKEEFSEYFKDCDQVVADILSESLNHNGIKTIVRNYNDCDDIDDGQ